MTISATSQGLKPGVVTSSNRPANPYDGMMIYETDTDKVLIWNGSAWKEIIVPWTSFTPTWTNLTVGNAAQSWAYQIVNDTVTVQGITTLGSTSSVTGVPLLTLPVNRDASHVTSIGTGTLNDTGTATYLAYPISTANNSVYFFATSTGSTYASESNTSSTVPFTWTNGDLICATLIYRRA